MSGLRAEVRLAAESPGFNREGLNYIDCPECGGKGKMMVGLHQDGAAWFKCMRATCQVQGVTNRVTSGPAAAPKQKQRLVPAPAPQQLDATQVARQFNSERRESGRLGLPPLVIGRAKVYRTCFGKWAVPLFDHEGIRYGTMLVSWTGGSKAIFERHLPGEHRLAWYHAHNPGLIVLVEDVFSAARLALEGITSVALLGTTLGAGSEKALRHVAAGRHRTVVCLDADATEKSVRLARRLGGAFVPLIGPDVKDMLGDTFREFCQTLETYRV